MKKVVGITSALLVTALLFCSCNLQADVGETEQGSEASESETRQTLPKDTESTKKPTGFNFPKPPEPTGELVDTIKVMTYNLQGGQPDGRTLTARSAMHAAKINLVDPDVVLLCEARNFDNWRQDLNVSVLTAKCDVKYGIIEFSEAESTNVILYNEEKFECLSAEALKLADGGDEYSRSAVIAVLRVKESGEELVAVSTHLDLNYFATKEQIWEIIDHIDESYSQYQTRIIAGDLNCESFAATMLGGPNAVHEDGLLASGYYSANQKPDRTYTHKSKILDYVYFTGLYPTAYRVVTDAVGDYEPSDHYPVYTELGIYR